MLDHQDGTVGRDALDQRRDALDIGLRHARHRLVEEQHFWIERQGGGDFQSALAAVGEFVRFRFGEFRQADFAEQQAVDLPYGRKRALEIATTLALEPEMMLLDEPMAGLGQEDIKRIAQLIRTVAKDRTVLMVEHNMSVVADLSDTITVLARGEVLAEGPYATVSQHPLVIEAYVGTGHG